MEKKKSEKRRSATKIIPPSKSKNEALSRDEIRSINKKKMLKKRKAKKIALLWLFGVIVVCIGIVLTFSLLFKINTIDVKGDKVYADKDIISKSNIEIGSNLFRVNEDKINESISTALPYIKYIKVDKKLPDKVIITVYSTREVAAIQSATSFILVDHEGKVLDKDASILRDGVAVVNGVALKKCQEGQTIELKNKTQTDNFITLLKAIKASKLNLLTEINLQKTGEFQLIYDNRIKIKPGSMKNITKKLQRGKAAIDKENEINSYSEGILDLRTEPYAYFNAGKEEPTTKVPTTVPQTDEEGNTLAPEGTTERKTS